MNFIVERVDFLFLKDRFSWTCTLQIESASQMPRRKRFIYQFFDKDRMDERDIEILLDA